MKWQQTLNSTAAQEVKARPISQALAKIPTLRCFNQIVIVLYLFKRLQQLEFAKPLRLGSKRWAHLPNTESPSLQSEIIPG